MLILQSVIHCNILQAQVSFQFNSVLLKFPPKYYCNPNKDEIKTKRIKQGKLKQREIEKFFNSINLDLQKYSTTGPT